MFFLVHRYTNKLSDFENWFTFMYSPSSCKTSAIKTVSKESESYTRSFCLQTNTETFMYFWSLQSILIITSMYKELKKE